ncbi:MAG: ribosomal-protein-alanine N-acetyltransferase [Cellvibrionaceae bacterium]|jgi:ribosomal-protein-alanine N-acetyltransferase
MEIANDENGKFSDSFNRNSANDIQVWQARESDFGAIKNMLESAPWRHKHVDWFESDNWLGSPSFIMSQSAGGANGCLAITAAPKPGAWVRLAALERHSFNRKQSFLQMASMVDAVCDHLHKDGVSIIGWMAPIAWPDEWPEKLGFSESEKIITYQKPTFALPSIKPVPSLRIRPGKAEDMVVLEEIESRAFFPLWRHSALGLTHAMAKAFSFDVALIGDSLVGFQHSAPGRGSAAHLARITVDPEFQGHGIGSQLLAHAIKDYQRRGAIDMTLNTESSNIKAQKLYARFGYASNGYRYPLYTMELT